MEEKTHTVSTVVSYRFPKNSLSTSQSPLNTLLLGLFTLSWLSSLQYCVKRLISFCETMQQNQSSLFVHSCVESSSTQLDLKLFPHTTPTVSLALPCTHIHIHPLAHKYNKAETGAGGAGMTVMLHVQFGTSL